jgi:hypothetical protein
MKEFGLTEKERVEALVESAYQVARERHRFGTGDGNGEGSLLFKMARELEKLYDRVYGERGMLYQMEMTNNMLSFYKELAEKETEQAKNE